MKWWKVWTCLTVALALTAVGCPKETELGGTGATPGGEAVDAEKTFSLKLPDGTNVTQGTDEEATISLDAGAEFMEEVVVTLTPKPGISIEPSELTLSHEKPDGKVMIKADATAEMGDHVVDVSGKPATGTAVDSRFTVTVDEASDDEGTGDPDTVEPADPATDLPPADGDATVP